MVTRSVSGAPAPVSRPGVIEIAAITGFWDLVEQAARLRPEVVILADDHGRNLTPWRSATRLSRGGGPRRTWVKAGDVVSWQLPTTLEAAVLMAALRVSAQCRTPIIALLREREVEFMLDQVGTAPLIVPDTWKDYRHADIADAFLARHPGRQALVSISRRSARTGASGRRRCRTTTATGVFG